MSIQEETGREERIEERLARIEARVERGNQEGRRAGQAFAIFALFALLIALGNLVALATGADRKTVTVTRSAAPAPRSAATAAPVVPAKLIGVNLREYTVNPSSKVGQAGKVTFNVQNSGTVTHEFVVIRTDKPAGSLLKGARADETGNVGETGDLKPGQAKTISLNLAAGHYALICNLPGHYAAGQHTDFTVR
jgi:uncharacterized cupredoxin-like copper-binding protein